MCYYQSTYVPTLDVRIVRRQKKHETTLKVNYVTSGSHKTYVHEFRHLFFEDIQKILYEKTENGNCISLKLLHTYIHTYVRTYVHTYINTYIHTYVVTYVLTCK